VFLVAFGFMWMSLHFSKYKKRNSGCCSSTAFDQHDHHGYSCGTCPEKDLNQDTIKTIIETEKYDQTRGRVK